MISVLVIGAGAIGCLYGSQLAKAGAKVSVISRSDYDHVSREGIHIHSVWGDWTWKPEGVYPNSTDYQGPQQDLVIVSTKAYANMNVETLLSPVMSEKTTLLILQNGIEIEAPFKAAFPKTDILSGLAFVCVSKTGPGAINHQDYGRLVVGPYPKGHSKMAETLAQLLNGVGTKTSVDKQIQSSRWKKLVWNAPFNPLSVIEGGLNTQELLATSERESHVRRIMAEVCQVATADGYPLGPEIIEKNITETKKMTPYKTSMALDYEFGRPLETEAILGNLIHKAHDLGVKTPECEALYKRLIQIESKAS